MPTRRRGSAMRIATILTNGRIWTTDDGRQTPDGGRTAEAVAVDEAGRIAAVGTSDEVQHIAQPETRVIDLRGMSVVPGFNDCHMHLLPYGLDLARADLSPAAGITDVPSLVLALRRWVEENPASEWVLGNRYDQNTFPGAAHPTRQE